MGKWQDAGDYTGTDSYEWMEGGFFLIHHFDGIAPSGFHAKGVEYIGFDEDTQTLRSHLMDIAGSNFTYTWDITGDVWTICSETKVRKISTVAHSIRMVGR